MILELRQRLGVKACKTYRRNFCAMTPKKMLLFSASILLFICADSPAQQPATPATPAAQAESSTAIAIAPQGGNFLGITATEVTRENMGRYSLREPRGVVVTRVSDDSPASRAGLKAGDVILRFDGEQVTTYRKLQRLISEAAPEQNVRLGISRNGAEQEISVTLGSRKDRYQDLIQVYPAQPGAEARTLLEGLRNQAVIGFGSGRRIGVGTTELTKQLADYFGVQGGRGVLVTSVVENSPAARAGIRAGDVITEAEGEKIESSGDLSRAINRKTEGAVNLRIVRDRNPITVTVTPEKREVGALLAPELFEIEAGAVELALPTIDIRLPQIKQVMPVKIPRMAMPKLKITPKQLEQLRKLESLNLENLLLL